MTAGRKKLQHLKKYFRVPGFAKFFVFIMAGTWTRKMQKIKILEKMNNEKNNYSGILQTVE